MPGGVRHAASLPRLLTVSVAASKTHEVSRSALRRGYGTRKAQARGGQSKEAGRNYVFESCAKPELCSGRVETREANYGTLGLRKERLMTARFL